MTKEILETQLTGIAKDAWLAGWDAATASHQAAIANARAECSLRLAEAEEEIKRLKDLNELASVACKAATEDIAETRSALAKLKQSKGDN